MKAFLRKTVYLSMAAVLSVSLLSCGTKQESVNQTAERTAENTTEKQRVELLIEEMSLQEKVEQMLLPSFRYVEYDGEGNREYLTEMNDLVREEIRNHNYAGVILFAPNIESAGQTVTLIQEFKKANAEGDNIPLLIAADQEGGAVRRIPFGTYHIGNMGLAAIHDSNEVRSAARLIGEELAALGINTNFAPVVDVNSDPANPVIGVRSFSDDPSVVSINAAAYLAGLNDENIIGALKHFPGHGDTDTDSHTGMPQIMLTYEEMKETHLKPFRNLAGDADIIMSAHIQFPLIDDTEYTSSDGSTVYLPATLSKKILTDILREDMGYEGVICTDSLAMDAIREYYDPFEAAVMAINAGADILLIPILEEMEPEDYSESLDDLVKYICSKVESGEISIGRINESVIRIMQLKEKRGILDDVPADDIDALILNAEETVGSQQHHIQEFNAAEKAVTLLKNEDDVLPLSSDTKTVVLVPFESQINSVDYAEEYLEHKGLLEEGSIEALCYGTDPPDVIIDRIAEEEADTVVYVTSVYEITDLYDYDLLLPVIGYAEDAGIDQIALSASLPYDLSLFDDSEVHMACYQASGMPDIPVFDGRENDGYGAGIPAALAVMYNDERPQGKLPVDVPIVVFDDGYRYSDELMYRRGDGIGY
ncbi:MAG: hypothetical protein E7185_12360 [Erysipelotrichaceae bacterium]|nr:hypothetical protein [Erysipelotrichaceae bacterium]